MIIKVLNVNERAGDIEGTYPTEAVAWIDLANNGYPSLYAANYEICKNAVAFPIFSGKTRMAILPIKVRTMAFANLLY
jgi:hypothetical protein